MRYRNPEEKADRENSNDNSMDKFIKSELKFSVFDRDFMYVTDFEQDYKTYCDK
jgi:hypothetical protein